MTPQQLLEEVKGRFIILFHSDESALTALLRQSLGKFQEKAGIIFSVSAESATIPLPPDYWRTAMVHDAKWRYVPSRLNRETNEILLDTDSRNVSPYSLYYLISLRNTPDNTFDSCVTNVPFGDARGASMHEDPAFKKEKQIERYVILRILDKIRPGGLACLVCPINIVGAKGKKWEEFRIAVSKKAEFLGAHKLPSKTFNAQGTDTVVDVVVFRKHGADFLTSVDETPFEVLKATKVVWEPFVKGDYWKGEGKPFIMGRYIPKAAGDRWSREEVQGEIDSTAIKQKLAQKFHSRIDWEALSLVEPITRNYGEGDKRIINGEPHTMIAGEWIKDAIDSTPTAIDPKKYGAESLEQLEGILSGDKGGLSLSLENMFSIYKSYPAILSPLQKEAVEFAMGQPKAPLREQLYRGVILGGLLARMSSKSDAGEDVTADRTALQELVVADLERFGHPKNNKGLVLAGEGSRMFGLFKNAVDEQGNFSDLLAGTLDKSKKGQAYNPADPYDIVIHLFVREGQEDIWLEDVQKSTKAIPR